MTTTDPPTTAELQRRDCTGKYAPKHLPTVVYTRRLRDLLRRRYWVRCWDCDLLLGPFLDRGFARFVEADLNG